MYSGSVSAGSDSSSGTQSVATQRLNAMAYTETRSAAHSQLRKELQVVREANLPPAQVIRPAHAVRIVTWTR